MVGSIMPAAMSGRTLEVELDVVELWVHSIARTSRVLGPFGFAPDAGVAPDSRSDCIAAGLRSGDVGLILREGAPTSEVARFVGEHGDGVGEVGLACDEPEQVLRRAQAFGVASGWDGTNVRLDLMGDGTVVHTVRARRLRLPATGHTGDGAIQLGEVDHVTYCLPFGTIDRVARAYCDVLGLAEVAVPHSANVGDDLSGMHSRVLRSPLGFTVVLTAPRSPSGTGQTQHFLAAHAGAGVQHVAIACPELAAAVPLLRSRGVPFLAVPDEHLQQSYARMGDRALPWDVLRREGILVDGDGEGLLFQLFTEPITDRRTFFFELIHRKGSSGFGAGNVRALFAAVDASMRRARATDSSAPARPSGSAGWSSSLVDNARARVPFYAAHLAACEGTDFALVPSFDKSAVARHGRFPMSSGGARGAHRVLATSGTSGRRLYVSFDEAEWQRTGRWLEMVGRHAGMTADDVLLNTHCYGLWVGGPALDQMATRCGAGLVPLGPVAPALVLDLLADGVGTAISATPSYLRRLIEAAEAARFDLRTTPLRVGFIGAEPADTSLRQKLVAHLPEGFRWIELYGLTETGGPAVAFAPDPDVAELVVNTDDFLIEVLDPAADRPAAPGEVGELVITTRRADGRTPLVRYRTRDLVRATAGPLDAPTRISRILGRADDALKIGGVLLYPSAAAEIMSERLPPAAEWRALVRRTGEDDELVIEAEASPEDCRAVEQAFRERVGLGLTVVPRTTGTLSRSLEKTQRILIGSPA